MNEKRIELEEKFLNRIKSKLDFSKSAELKKGIMIGAFLDFCNSLGEQECVRIKDGINKEKFLKELQGYGLIDPLLDDPEVEDIVINGTEPIYIHHAKKGFIKTDKRFLSLRELDLLIKKILIFTGKNKLKKINNIDLPMMRGRVNIIYSPLGPDLTISKIKINPYSVIDLIENGTLNTDMAALLWLYIEGLEVKPANILISGGPGSGKTTLLNALLGFIPTDQHTVVIEDSYELVTSWIDNASRLESDEDLSLADLVKNSLRMRPERIIVGEVRGNEAEDMITAMNIGKYCMGTIHASTVRETILRLQNHPMNVSETLINLVDVFIVMRKIKVGDHISRVMYEIVETAGLEEKTVLVSPLWRYDLASNSFGEQSPSTEYRDRLSQVSGLTGPQVLSEINKRKDFIDKLRQAKISSIKDVSYYCQRYLKDYQGAISDINKLILHSP